jgi:hypothetical protein
VGSIIHRTLAISLGWCVYRAASWAASVYLRDNHPLLGVQVAFVISAIAVVLIIVMDKILDCALGRNGLP